MEFTRRDFLKMAAGGVLTFSVFNPQLFAVPEENGNWDRVLVLIELRGGNDGLNTLIPYQEKLYYSYRPRLAVPSKNVLKLTETVGFHPNLKALWEVWKAKELAVVQGVGYPKPNRSHFRSIDIWETASNSDEYLEEGWISRLFAKSSPPKDVPADGLILDTGDEGPLRGFQMRNIVLKDPKQFVREAMRLKQVAASSSNPALRHLVKVQQDILHAARALQKKLTKAPALGVQFPKSGLAKQMEIAAKLLAGKTPAPVIKLSIGGFDTHSNQRGRHQKLLRDLAEAMAAFRLALKKIGKWRQVLVMTYSEFGRRVRENGSAGTDHGTAAPHFIMGGAVKGGLLGKYPPLDDLQNGDLKFQVDYRCMYTTVAKNWWKVSAQFMHPEKYPPLDVL
ncbi:MAG: DUF1501 domain-containing protein [Planctomycetota bacterium]|nr:MAG: DUF1501 domain-containing protein [Planctomycetota bacterium]